MTWSKLTDRRKLEGTCLQGQIITTYDHIKSVFGEPSDRDIDGKIQVEWDLLFYKEVVATVYDWKEHVKPKLVTQWHIGGKSELAKRLVKEALRQ